MTALLIDGFDHYTTPGQKGWTVTGNAGITATPRTGVNSLYTQGNWQAGTNGDAAHTFSARDEIVLGVAIRMGHAAGALPWRLELREGGTTHISVELDASARMAVKRGVGGTVLGTTTSPLVNGSFVHLQIRVKIHDTTGTLTVKVNDLTEITLTGLDTRNGGATGLLDTLYLFCGQITFEGAWTMYHDDLYILDVLGTENNDFLGDCKVETLYPNGNGNSSQFDGSDGNTTDNYLLVDETVPNSDTDYVESADAGDKDTYAYGNLTTLSGTVFAVQPVPFAKKNDAGPARSIVSVARLSGTETDSAVKTLSTSYAYFPDIRATKPGGGQWTIADVNSAEFGVKVNA
jgi:hypothetical protein